MAVDGGAGDAEFGGDLGDGVSPSAVGASLVVHALGDPDLAGGELGPLPPPVRPRARAAARPSRVRSAIKGCSNSAMAPRMWKDIRPTAVKVSIPWSITTRSTPRARKSLEMPSQHLELGLDASNEWSCRADPVRIRQRA